MFADVLVPASVAGVTITVGIEAVTRWRRWRERIAAEDSHDLAEADEWFRHVRSDWYFDLSSDPALIANGEDDGRRTRHLVAPRRPMPGRPDRVNDFETRHKQIADRCANIEATLSSP